MENNGPCVCVCASATHHFFKRHGCAFVLFMTPTQSRYWSHLRALTRSKTSAPHHHHYYHHSSQEREESCCCCCAGCLSYCCSLRRIVTSPLQRLSIDLSFNPFIHSFIHSFIHYETRINRQLEEATLVECPPLVGLPAMFHGLSAIQ